MIIAVKEERDDYELMRLIAERDQSAFTALYDRHSGMVYSLCLRILRDREAAEDLLVDVFWELWDKSGRYDASRGTPVTYLMTLARSRAIDRLRSKGRAGVTMSIVDAD